MPAFRRVRYLRETTLVIIGTLTFYHISSAQSEPGLAFLQSERGQSLSLNGQVFHTTTGEVQHPRAIQIPDSSGLVALWEERGGTGARASYYAISPDGQRVAAVKQTSYDVLLRYDRFDPLLREPLITGALNVPAGNIYIVQFHTQPLESYRQRLRSLGATIYKFLPNHAYLVKMSASVRDSVAAEPYVRWVGPYHVVYRLGEFVLEEVLLANLGSPLGAARARRFNIQVFERGAAQQQTVARYITQTGGIIHEISNEGFVFSATLRLDSVMAIAGRDEVMFIDEWSPAQTDMDLAREIGGANALELTAGFTGTGVRGEVMDGNVRATHAAFQATPILFHGPHSGSTDHGTGTYGIVFGDGAASAMGRGMLPNGQGLFADYELMTNRYVHTAELLQEPFLALFQSNSWGNTQTTVYTTISAQMDDILFINDIVITQSQSNTGNRNSRPQAWAKNVVSVGGIHHRNTLTTDDDCWGCLASRASIGPAADGRLKPDLAHFYDFVWTTGVTSDTFYRNFGGTSAATPIVAGHFGLFFEMWHNGIFGNPTGPTPFVSRPHMTTSKAMLINSARPWNFTSSTADLSRAKQGWGLPDLQNLYDRAGQLVVVDETDVLPNLGVSIYYFFVTEGAPPLRATLVYADPSGTTSATQHRINDLTLRVTSPSGVTYWGNNGLLDGIWSQPDGVPNTIDTVENVLIETPEPGWWSFEVIASEINEDSHLETPEVDADYALVVSGVMWLWSAPFGGWW